MKPSFKIILNGWDGRGEVCEIDRLADLCLFCYFSCVCLVNFLSVIYQYNFWFLFWLTSCVYFVVLWVHFGPFSMNSLVYFSGDMLINFLTDIMGVCWFSKDTSLFYWSNFSVCVWMLGNFWCVCCWVFCVYFGPFPMNLLLHFSVFMLVNLLWTLWVGRLSRDRYVPRNPTFFKFASVFLFLLLLLLLLLCVC